MKSSVSKKVINGTSYRNVFKLDHLGKVDLEEFLERGMSLVFTIEKVEQLFGVEVAGKKINANIAHFKEDIKPWVINATNGDIMKQLTGSIMVENWGGIRVELYINHKSSLMGEKVGGIAVKNKRIEPKQTMNQDHKLWDKLKIKTIENGTTIEQIRLHYDITQENYSLLCG